MSQLKLDKRTREVLDHMRHGRRTLSVHEMPADLAEAEVRQ